MIFVKMSNQDVVNLSDSRFLGYGNNAVGIASVVSRPSCIDQQRVLLRRHEQGCLSSLGVYKKYAQGLLWGG
jgi:hypothetical protein